MAEIDNQPPVIAPDPAKIELDRLMQYALSEGKTPLEPEIPAGDQVAGGAASTATPITAPVFSFDTLKEKFGYQKPEDAMAEIESLRALKANPPIQEYKFETEDAKKVFDLLRTGKVKEALTIHNQQERLNELLALEVNKDNAAEVVKYGLQLKHKDLSSSEIDYKFKKMFSVPPKPTKTVGEDDEDFSSRVAEWQEIANDKQMELIIEAKMLRPELETSKTKLSYPDISQQTDPDYVAYKKIVDDNARLGAEAAKEYQSYTPKSVEVKIPYVDKTNKVEFEFQYEPDQTVFTEAMAHAMDIDKFYDLFQKPDGSPDRQKFAKFIFNGLNAEKMVLEAMNQAKNATLKSFLPDNSQDGGLVRQLVNNTVAEESEVDKQMRARGMGRQ